MNSTLIVGLIGLALAIVGCNNASHDKQTAVVTSATIQLPTLKCKTCVSTVKRSLSDVQGIESAEVHLEEKNVVVKFLPATLDIGKIERTISKAGYDANSVKRDSAAYEALAECCK